MIDDDVRDEDYRRLARFRHDLRKFLRFSENAARAAGLTPRHYQALLAIRAAPDEGMTVGELAEQMLLKPHSTTGLVDRLADAGLAERVRSEGDRRHVRVRPTAAALALLASIAGSHRAELRRLRPMLTELIEAL
ncbi:MAG TPA: MarR family transcriptional regulator [Sphingomonas sp.]|nr:MarR family transcriptional regulator [Sphingomonas sp.]